MSANASTGSPVNAWEDDWEKQADVCYLWSQLIVITINAIPKEYIIARSNANAQRRLWTSNSPRSQRRK